MSGRAHLVASNSGLICPQVRICIGLLAKKSAHQLSTKPKLILQYSSSNLKSFYILPQCFLLDSKAAENVCPLMEKSTDATHSLPLGKV